MTVSKLSFQRSGREVRLTAAFGTFSYYHPDYPFTECAWDSLSASLLLGTVPMRRILILGLGAGTVARQVRLMFPAAELVGVELDPTVIRRAEKLIPLGAWKIQIELCSSQQYLRQSGDNFDAIIDDVWPADPRQARPFETIRHWDRLVRNRLGSGGIYALCIRRRQDRRSKIGEAVRILETAFSRVAEVRPALGPTTVLAASDEMGSARRAHRWRRSLGEPVTSGLSHIRYCKVSRS